MAIRVHRVPMVLAVVALLCAAGWLPQLSQAQGTGSFDDDDPSNDPNVCHTAADPANCDWTRGWYQAALNLGHIEIQDAQTAYKDMHVTEWLPAEKKLEREEELKLFEDDDPTNDPNECYSSPDPNCNWIAGWYRAIGRVARVIPPEVSDSGVLEILVGEANQYWLEARKKEAEENPEKFAKGTIIVYGLCPPGTSPVYPDGLGPVVCV